MSTFSASASIAPIVLWSPTSKNEGLYLQTKNTFLDFFADENKKIKRTACPRSFSHDSVLKRADSRATTAVHSNSSRPSSPSVCSFESWNDYDEPILTPRAMPEYP